MLKIVFKFKPINLDLTTEKMKNAWMCQIDDCNGSHFIVFMLSDLVLLYNHVIFCTLQHHVSDNWDLNSTCFVICCFWIYCAYFYIHWLMW